METTHFRESPTWRWSLAAAPCVCTGRRRFPDGKFVICVAAGPSTGLRAGL